MVTEVTTPGQTPRTVRYPTISSTMTQLKRLPTLALILVAFTVAALTGLHAWADEASAGPLASAVGPLLDKHVMAGAVMLVANRDKVLDVEAIGDAQIDPKEPMRADDLFWIASMSKSMTATALMMLVDEGKVKIDDPVEKYLPEFKGQQVVDPKDMNHPHPPAHPITIKEILSHTSGMVLASDKALKQNYNLKLDVAEYASIPLHCEPGTKYQYNNDGINTAGRIIEVVSGISYADFMQHRLFDALEMTDTTFWPTDEQAKRMAHAVRLGADKRSLEQNHFDKELKPALIARFSNGAAVPQPMLEDMGLGVASDYGNRYAMPAGGIYSTAKDVGRFCQMLLNRGIDHGKPILSEKAVAQMTSPETGDVPVSPSEGYGLGWSVKLKDDEGLSVGSFGHRGARRTAMWVDPKNELVMVIMVERMDMPGSEQKQLYSTFMRTAIATYGKRN